MLILYLIQIDLRYWYRQLIMISLFAHIKNYFDSTTINLKGNRKYQASIVGLLLVEADCKQFTRSLDDTYTSTNDASNLAPICLSPATKSLHSVCMRLNVVAISSK